jgi:hypothetical protein
MSWKPITIRALILAGGVGFTLAFWINWCNLIYQCGCASYWAGGADHCNIHQAGVHHCPWCTNATYGGMALAFTLACQGVAAFWPGLASAKSLLLTLAVSPLAAGVAGALIGVHAGYWS